MTSAHQPIKLTNLLCYGFFALPVAFAGFPIYVLGPDYYAAEHGLSLTSLAVVLFILRVIDAFQDPLIGYYSDRFSKWREGVVCGGAVFLFLGFWLLFHPPLGSGLLVSFALFMFVVTTAYSVLVINISALGGMWSVPRHERTRVAATREGFGLIGLLLAVTLPSVLQNSVSIETSFGLLGLVLAIFLMAGLILFLSWYRRNRHVVEVGASQSAPGGVTALLRGLAPEARFFYLIYGISMLASSIPAVLVIFFVRDYLDGEVYLGLFLTLYFLGAALSMNFWSQLCTYFDRKAMVWLGSMMLAIFSFGWALLLAPGDLWGYGLICLFSGIALGGEMAIPPSLLADRIQDDNQKLSSGMLYALMTLLAKVSLAASTAVVFPLLDQTGFRPDAENGATSLYYLKLSYAGIPLIIKFISIVLLFWFIRLRQFNRAI